MASSIASSVQSRIDGLLAGNKEYQKHRPTAPSFPQIVASTERPPAVVIITCADPRVVPEKFFNFSETEFPVIRNAGGRAADALRSLAVLDQALTVRAVLIVQHTDCGLVHLRNEDVAAGLKKRVGSDDAAAAKEIDGTDFGHIGGKDFEGSLRRDVQVVKESGWFSKDLIVKGFVFDLEGDGSVREVVA